MRSRCLKLVHYLTLLLLSGTLGAQEAKKEALALIDGEAITTQEVERALAPQLSKIEEQIHALKKQKLEALIQSKLLAREAARRGLSLPALLELEVNSKISAVTDQEVEKHYQANKARYSATNYADQIRTLLQTQRRAVHQRAFISSLRSKANITVHLKPPAIYRVDVSIESAPLRGSANAPVTIVEFSDFHCPYCKQVQPTLTRILTQYRDQVRLAYRDLPLDQLHPNARKAAEAARCAKDQGRFWEYHDKLYSGGTDASPEKLSALAQETGINVSAFGECLASGRHKQAIEKDGAEAAQLGVAGTPNFFINGRALSGSQSYEVFASIIDAELQPAGHTTTNTTQK